MDTVAQVVLLIGVVCVVVMGVSLRGGSFIITALSLLLYLAFQRHDGTLSSTHENILKQIPSTIEEALARLISHAKRLHVLYARVTARMHPLTEPDRHSLATLNTVPTIQNPNISARSRYWTHNPTVNTIQRRRSCTMTSMIMSLIYSHEATLS